jgi:hypothetical protein
MTDEHNNVTYLPHTVRTFTFDPTVPLNLSDDDRYRMFIADARRLLAEEPRRLSMFVWCNADLVEEMSDSHPQKALMREALSTVVRHVVVNAIGGLASNNDAQSPSLKAVCRAVREGQWFGAAAATRAWHGELKRNGVDDDDIAFMPHLRDVFLGLVKEPWNEQSGRLPAWVEYAKSYGSDRLFGHVAKALLRARKATLGC